MRIRVNEVHLKTLLNEEKFNIGFKRINVGDNFIVITDKQKFDGKVLNKTGNEILIKVGNKNYILNNNSLSGNKLEYVEKVNGKLVSRGEINDIKNIQLYRNNKLELELPPDGSEREKEIEKNDKSSEEEFDDQEKYQENLKEYKSLLEKVKVNSTIEIESVKNNKHSMIEFHIREINGNLIQGVTLNESGEYSSLDEAFIKIDKKNSLDILPTGIFMVVKDSKTNEETKIEGITSFTTGTIEGRSEITFDDMMQNKNFRDLMLTSNLMSQIAGGMNKGILPADEVIKKLGLSANYFSKGKKVKFKYTGKTIETENNSDLKVISGQEYVGSFLSSKVIRLVSTKRRGQSIKFLLDKQIDKNEYQVSVEYIKLIDGKEEIVNKPNGLIKILDSNYKS